MDEVLVSVIVPTYNREKILPRAINSILNQTIKNFELIIVDDRSNDNTKEIVMEYSKKDKRIKYVINTNKRGPAGARNKGIEVATGRYIAFLDSDDEWKDFHLERAINLMQETNSTASYAYWYQQYGDICEDVSEADQIITQLNSAVQASCVNDYEEYFCLKDNFLEYTIISCFYCYNISTLVMERGNIEKTGNLNEDLFTSEDVDFAYRIIDKCKVVIDKKPHYIYYDDADNHIYNYIDREILDTSKAVKDKELVTKLNFDGEYKIKMRLCLKELVNNSENIENKDKCIEAINKSIEEKYYTLALINVSVRKTVNYAYKLFLTNRSFTNFKFLCMCVFNHKKDGIYNLDFY